MGEGNLGRHPYLSPVVRGSPSRPLSMAPLIFSRFHLDKWLGPLRPEWSPSTFWFSFIPLTINGPLTTISDLFPLNFVY